METEILKENLKKHNQEQVLKWTDGMIDEEQKILYDQLKGIDVASLNK